MPPKKKGNEPSNKTIQKAQNKVIEDKTFGLKNKNKSKAVQKFIKGVESTVKNKGQSEQKLKEMEFQEKADRKKEEERQALLSSLYKSVETINQREAAAGEDPKSIICAYFKQGLCQKGRKCKFSHDLAVENKAAKIDLYTDPRDHLKDGETTATGEIIKKPTTDIVCKHFLDAVEKNQYGWQWSCPSGVSCIYRHALPQGFILKKDLAAMGNQEEDAIPLEERLEEDRMKLFGKAGTPVTLERFLKWKEDRKKRKEEEEKKKMDEAVKKGKGKHSVLSGRSLFKYDPTMFQDDEEAEADVDYQHREEEEEASPPPKRPEETKEEEDGEEEKQEDEEEGEEGEEEEGEEDEEEGEEEENGHKKKKKVDVDEDVFAGEEDVDLKDI